MAGAGDRQFPSVVALSNVSHQNPAGHLVLWIPFVWLGHQLNLVVTGHPDFIQYGDDRFPANVLIRLDEDRLTAVPDFLLLEQAAPER